MPLSQPHAPSTKSDGQHRLNLAALLFSAVVAVWAPLPAFLIAYAVMGPFHYLTEIAWLEKKDFFFRRGIVPPQLYVALSVALCALATGDLRWHYGWTGYAVGFLLVLSLGAVVPRLLALAGLVVLFVAIRLLLPAYGHFLAAFVPTVVHVYVFTLIFLLSGAMRSPERTALKWINPALLLFLPVLLMRLPLSSAANAPGHYWMASEGLFAGLHEYISGMIGTPMHFDAAGPLSPAAVATFRFLAFIYVHHYLNWFAKTELLSWHRVSRRAWAAIGVIYVLVAGSYAYSFALGFYVSYFLSLLHVLLELPLNWRGGAGLVTEPLAAWRARHRAPATEAGALP